MVADKIVTAFIKILAADAQTAIFGSTKDCSLARALNRRLKKIYRADCASTFFDIDLVNGGRVCQDLAINHSVWNEQQFNKMKEGKRGDLILKVQIPAKYLKRIHKPRVKVVAPVAPVAAPVLTFKEKQLNQVRHAADILDKVFPKWKEVNTDNCNLASIEDCLLMRVGKLHNDNRRWSSIYCDTIVPAGLKELYPLENICEFASEDLMPVWIEVIAERKAAEEAAKPKFDRPENIDEMRQAAKILDKLFPNWRAVDLVGLNMASVRDCLLVRIVKLHGLPFMNGEGMWSSYNNFLEKYHGMPDVFTASTTLNDWTILIAEGKQD